MTTAPDCIFCRIAAGDVPARVVYRDEDVVAFEDTSPQAPVHVLVIPRAHYEHLGDGIPDYVLASLFKAVPKVAAEQGIARSGYRTIVNAGSDAGQTVSHLHVHVLGGRHMSHGMVRFVEQ